ncbi:hypothetical protein [Lentzea sp. NPDC060358]|uniref:hypothetical protein n=1 Tax=Lentzea sp. NPDC060358 TaxID=3347103 RepID=UPI0036699630
MTACHRCGRSRSSVSDLEFLAWSSERTGGAVRWLCHVCAKAHVRDIEGKLPDEYWR